MLKNRIENVTGINDIHSNHRGFLLEISGEIAENKLITEVIKTEKGMDWDEVSKQLKKKLKPLSSMLKKVKGTLMDKREIVDKVSWSLSKIIRDTVEANKNTIKLIGTQDKSLKLY